MLRGFRILVDRHMKIEIKYVGFDPARRAKRGEQLVTLTYCNWTEDGIEESANTLTGDEIPNHVREALALVIAPWLAPKRETA